MRMRMKMTISYIDIEVIRIVFIFIFFMKKFKHLKNKQKDLSHIQPDNSRQNKPSK